MGVGGRGEGRITDELNVSLLWYFCVILLVREILMGRVYE